jgi:tetratricopeptide (TPR) repeat protein
MNKENTLYGVIGLLIGLIVGYIGTTYLNSVNTPISSTEPAPASRRDLPANHPATGGTRDDSSGDPQGDVMAVIQQARNEPANFDAQIQAASMFRQINRHEQALEFYDRALKIKPKDHDLLVKLGDANFDLQRFEEAERWYESALKLKPNDATVRMDLGLTFYLRQPRDIERAVAEYRKALSYDPRHEKTLQNLIAALIEKGDQSAARAALKQLEQVNPENQALAQFRDRLKYSTLDKK